MTKVNYTAFTKNEKEDGEQTERKPNINRALTVVAMFGLGTAIFGFSRGYKIGYNRGVKDGIVHMSGKFIEATKAIATEVRRTEGE